ncbi:hypothetical protein WN943_021871 [Citrus x changshan-huyou]
MDLEALNMEDNSNMNDIMEDGETLMDDFLEPKSKKSKIGGGRLHDSERGSKAWPHHIKDEVNKTCKCKYCGKQYKYKLNNVSFCFEQLHNPEKVEEITSNIKKLLLKLYKTYCPVESTSGGGSQSSNDVWAIDAGLRRKSGKDY